MQNDLISRSDLHDTICKRFNIEDDWDGDIAEPLQTILDIIENFDIAYDVEEVVAEIEEYYEDARHYGFDSALSDIVEVVRNGWKE